MSADADGRRLLVITADAAAADCSCDGKNLVCGQNTQQLSQVLQPLKDKIQEFETGVNQRFLEETRDRGKGPFFVYRHNAREALQ